MDKYELNVKIEQIRKLARQKNYAQAANVADSIEFYRIRDNKVLSLLADVYEASGRYDQAKEVLIEAYERTSLGRQLAYRLVKLSVRSGNIAEAEEFYQDFIKVSPRDNSKYILQYELASAKGAPIEDRIAIIEKYLGDEMDEKWSFELAKLYHKAGLRDKCVKQCDDVILWFNDGKYVDRAMELKMIYAPLTKLQQAKYEERWMAKAPSSFNVEEIKVKEFDAANKYNTVNIEGAIKESMEALMRESRHDFEKDVIASDNASLGENDSFKVGKNKKADTASVQDICQNEGKADADIAPVMNYSYEHNQKEDELAKTRIVGVREQSPNSLLSHTIRDVRIPNINNTVPLSPMFDMESDGQIQLVSKEEPVDDQIEGQMTIEDMLRAYELREAEEARAQKELEEQEKAKKKFATKEIGEEVEKIKEVVAANYAKNVEAIAAMAESVIGDSAELLENTNVIELEDESEQDFESSMMSVTEDLSAIEEALAAVANAIVREEEDDPAEVFKVVSTDEDDDAKEASKETTIEESVELEESETLQEDEEKMALDEDDESDVSNEAVGDKESASDDRIFDTKNLSEEEIENAIRETDEEELEDIFEELDEEEFGEEAVEALKLEDGREEESKEALEKEQEESDGESGEEDEQEKDAEEASEKEQEESDSESGEEDEQEKDAEEAPEKEQEESDGESDEDDEQLRKARKNAESVDGSIVKALIREFVSKYSGIKGLDRQLLAVLQEAIIRENQRIVVMGEIKSGKTALAIDLIKIINKIKQARGRKIAKINGEILNGKDMVMYFGRLENMDIIIERAGAMTRETLESIVDQLETEDNNRIVIIEEEKTSAESMLTISRKFADAFKSRVIVKQNKIKDWAQVAINYARSKDYEIDEMGMLALHAKIDELYAISLLITKKQVEEVVDEAIDKSRNRGFGRVFRLFGKEREKILKEEDFS